MDTLKLSNEMDGNAIERPSFYRCGVCSRPFETLNSCISHMNAEHKKKQDSQLKKVKAVASQPLLKEPRRTARPSKSSKLTQQRAAETPSISKGVLSYEELPKDYSMVEFSLTDGRWQVSNPEKFKANIDVHMLSNGKPSHEKEEFLCSQSGCNLLFHSSSLLHLHERICHVSAEANLDNLNLFQCMLCQVQYTLFHDLQRHLSRAHQEELSVSQLRRDIRLVRHYQSFDGVKLSKDLPPNISCHHCGLVMKRWRLPNHILTVHKKIKTYKCPECDFKAARPEAIRLHFPKHTGVKQFQCNMCKYATRDKSGFNRHMKKHTGEKTYLCHYCTYSCIQVTSIRSHIKKKHPGLTVDFNCSLCPFKTCLRRVYDQHIVREHPREFPSDHSSFELIPMLKPDSAVENLPIVQLQDLDSSESSPAVLKLRVVVHEGTFELDKTGDT